MTGRARSAPRRDLPRRRRRIVVAFQECETPTHRLMRGALDGDLDVLPSQARRFDRYWCAADKPQAGDDLAVKPVYDGTRVPEGAECHACGISISKLQALMR